MAVSVDVSAVREMGENGAPASRERPASPAGRGWGRAAPPPLPTAGGGAPPGPHPGGAGAPPAAGAATVPSSEEAAAAGQHLGELGAPAVGEVDAGPEGAGSADQLLEVRAGARGGVCHRATPEGRRDRATDAYAPSVAAAT